MEKINFRRLITIILFIGASFSFLFSAYLPTGNLYILFQMLLLVGVLVGISSLKNKREESTPVTPSDVQEKKTGSVFGYLLLSVLLGVLALPMFFCEIHGYSICFEALYNYAIIFSIMIFVVVNFVQSRNIQWMKGILGIIVGVPLALIVFILYMLLIKLLAHLLGGFF